MPAPFYKYAYVTKDNLSPHIASLPKGAAVESVRIYVLTAFNVGTISVGYDADNDAYSAAQDVTTTGRKTPTLGTGVGLDTTPREVKAYHSGTPTSGKAIVLIEGYLLPPT